MGRHKATQPSEAMNQALRLRLKGLSYAEIGKAMGISRQRAQQLIRPSADIYNFVRRRAESRCQDCGIELVSGHVHHLNQVDNYNDPDNLMYLCVSCHAIAHGDGLVIPIVPRPEPNQDCIRCGHKWFSRLVWAKNCPECKTFQKYSKI